MNIGKLSPRQTQVYLGLAVGERNEDIARKLHISTKTVDTHRSHVLKTLQLRNNTDLARYALAHGHVPPIGVTIEPTPMPDIDYAALDPGISNAVRFLRQQGFDTVDSGDGYSKPQDERTIEGPHVFCRIHHYSLGRTEAIRALKLIRDVVGDGTNERGFKTDPTRWASMLLVEMSYSAGDETCILSITGNPLLMFKSDQDEKTESSGETHGMGSDGEYYTRQSDGSTKRW